MKILHTADWHLGVALKAEKRFDEFDALLDHICKIIKDENIEAVIIAGDVFDSHLPSNRAAEQYYRFLLQAGKAGARDIIVTGGNHDSASYLEAPKEVLKYLSVHVFATAPADCSELVLPLKDKDGKVAALVGAVPYIHERDLAFTDSYNGLSERESALRGAILDYYRKMAECLNERDKTVPHIVTGHLFVTDEKHKNDSWTGTLMGISADDFPESIDYLALGHLHDCHNVKTKNKTCVRYPGAPVNVSFRELEAAKSVTVIDTDDMENIREIPLPLFQDMRMLRGTKAEIEEELAKLVKEDHSIWCSIENTGDYEPALDENMRELVKSSNVKIINCHNTATNPAVIQRMPENRHLADLAPVDVFKLMLAENKIADELAEELLAAFNEIETAAREDEK